MKLQKFESVSRMNTWRQMLLLLLCITETTVAGMHFKNTEADDEPYHFRSAINNIEYSLLISLPNSYSENSPQKYPVLYVLDGQWDFDLMVPIYHNLRFDNSIPDVIIVGIGYYGQRPNYDSLRTVDMTPAKDHSTIGTGGGELFLDVLKKEIIPYVDENYATNRLERGISGTSLAGLYAHYLMFKANDLFNGFIIVNPYLVWDNEVSFRVENLYSMGSNDLNARAYMTSGEFDISDVFLRMVDQIQSRKYNGIDLEYSIQKGIGHTGSKHDGYSRGLIHL
jgi:predicted alpha/beta superfamily hydrolase